MAESTANNKANVSAAKGVAGGYLFRAPVGSTMPTDIKTQLDPAFKCCGFISEDGLTFSTEVDRTDLPDMNGDIMDSDKTSYKETCTAVLAEVKKSTMELLYGEGNVGDATGLLTVHVKGDDPSHYAYVFEGVLKNGRRWRRLIHDAQVTEMSDLAVKGGELFGREATMTVFKDGKTGDYYTDFFESTETAEG